ncbi:MAG: NADH-quinone oxidoreductase subunit L [Verrucomicrobiales bacterium]|nr:NADH-quinone oxidoreductase subunit L [Verrucomicrobiales bacterium]
MENLAKNLWVIPLLPLLAATVGTFLPRRLHRVTAGLSVAALATAAILAAAAFLSVVRGGALYSNVPWFETGTLSVRVGWILDPLSAAMLLMITVVGTLIFIFSTGYMAEDPDSGRFFCFLSLFAAAMLGLILSNSLLLLFICWELVGLASYLLIGFWYSRPPAADAARKAFLTTRIGDLGFLVGLIWLYSESGTVLFYDQGAGCLEPAALSGIAGRATAGGLALGTAISLLLFCGAVGKSGQLPLHVWLPDAMEGPTPVSALIHAATMVAAGVFLMARMFPLVALGGSAELPAPALVVMAWTGALTALFGALTAVAQTDIKRILAYSTISQLGFMMMGLATGGPAVGMVHLLTHAFFKALLFLGAGSVIHGCHGEQDIRHLGGLRRRMPLTFATYAVGMMALSGVPVFFSGFWSKDAILHSLSHWAPSRVPFLLGVLTAAVTAFYMTRQMIYVFAGTSRGPDSAHAHEGSPVLTVPLGILAGASIALSAVTTPFRPWLEHFLSPASTPSESGSVWGILILSALACGAGLAAGGILYRNLGVALKTGRDPLERWVPRMYTLMRDRFRFDEFYRATLVKWVGAAAWISAALDQSLGSVFRDLASFAASAGSWLSRTVDQGVLNASFDDGCQAARDAGGLLSRTHDGQPQRSLRILIAGVIALAAGLLFLATS